MILLFYYLKRYYYLSILFNVLILFSIFDENIKRQNETGYFYYTFFLATVVSYLVLFSFKYRQRPFRVFLSFSAMRLTSWSSFIKHELANVFWIYNISYYDYRNSVEYDPLDIPSICSEIDGELERAQIYLRFYDVNVVPQPVHIPTAMQDTIYNEYMGGPTESKPDYYRYEVEKSLEKFNNRFNRFQVVTSEVYAGTHKNITSFIPYGNESHFEFALRIVRAMRESYNCMVSRF